ncbi:MAG: tetraacyldisaccharide 4'-kinase [Hyphomicrobium sp.]|uniref:tetraacyldisaccharide 4'-kinase n=1 Tax=Hyphomicrobium sp. TaxID=82 RepID=UPI0025C028B8|nr:tetraacyldisaccharide 4'-kinase [Hyphomicrobium sp.]MBX9861220.1 tetraacyldisaccharide 4'-kinase [Hyphomicrobium sp.]
MRLDEPSWWYGAGDGNSLPARLLTPIEHIYAALAERRFATAKPYQCGLPVICVGNFTAGGTGKTPLTRFLIERLGARGLTAACLSRGYGGSLAGPVWVDGERHTARDVGDEPLLIAQDARVMIGRDRAAAASLIAKSGGIDAVIMDDGLQNPSLAKDLSFAVVSAQRGLGNGRVIPAGPLRARFEFQLGLVDGIVVMGSDADFDASHFDALRSRFHGPVLRAAVVPVASLGAVAGRAVIAYAGIANPERFFRLVESFAPDVLVRRAFADHHEFSEADARALIAEADSIGADLVTTEKDAVRLKRATGARAELAQRSQTLPIRVAFDERDLLRLDALIDGALKGVARR